MVDVSAKPDTLRVATARATVKIGAATVDLVKDGSSPKGNFVDAARVAATMAAKRTWDLLPYCHPIPLDSIKVDVEIKGRSIEITTVVKAIWKTGVEMEALTGASVAALVVYDMLKPIDEGLSIESISLVNKQGGLKTFAGNSGRVLTAAIIVASDSRHEAQDRSGKAAAEMLQNRGFKVVSYGVVPDDSERIVAELKRCCDELKVDLVITAGGTGYGPRDVTPEATRHVIDKDAAGIMDTIRAYGQKRTPFAMLSRGVAGMRSRTLIVNLPGSVRAVSESLESILPGLAHLYKMMEGEGHSH